MSDLFLTREEIKMLSTSLKQVATWVARELDKAISRNVTMSNRADVKSTTRDTPVYFNESVSKTAQRLADTLASWIDEICTYTNVEWPGVDLMSQQAIWLDRHLVDLAKLPEAPRAMREIQKSIRRAIAAVDRSTPPEFAGPCQSDLPGVTCDGVYVRPGTDTKRCTGCGVVCDVQKMQMAMRDEVASRLYPAAELASALSIVTTQKIPFERVRNWVRRGSLVPVTQNGEPMYKLHDAIELLNRRRGGAA